MGYKMQNGIVKWFNEKKGYGFLSSQGKDYFIHYNEIKAEGFKTLKEGDKVHFEPSSTQKGLVAKNLSLGHS